MKSYRGQAPSARQVTQSMAYMANMCTGFGVAGLNIYESVGNPVEAVHRGLFAHMCNVRQDHFDYGAIQSIMWTRPETDYEANHDMRISHNTLIYDVCAEPRRLFEALHGMWAGKNTIDRYKLGSIGPRNMWGTIA